MCAGNESSGSVGIVCVRAGLECWGGVPKAEEGANLQQQRNTIEVNVDPQDSLECTQGHDEEDD